jgi:hypothetical protein
MNIASKILIGAAVVKLVFAVTLAVSSSSQAQTTAPNPACAQQHATVGEGGNLAVENKNGANTTLSDKLAKSDGVICPPAGVDTDIKAPTPETGKMPVIPPPGTPDNQPNVRPK